MQREGGKKERIGKRDVPGCCCADVDVDVDADVEGKKRGRRKGWRVCRFTQPAGSS